MSTRSRHDEPTFVELFTPKLVTVLREGYGPGALQADVMAGLTVAIVALPLSMAIAIASGASPAQGLYSAIIGGFIVSLLGGSRFQIGGPAGAFIVLVSATVQNHGMDGLLLATFLSGIILTIGGYLRLGSYIKLIPYPVTVGFTAGIAVIIFTSQVKEIFGLTLSGHEPGNILEKLPVLFAARDTMQPAAMMLALAAILIIVGLKRYRPGWPGMLMAVMVTALATALLNLPVTTIGSAFGGIPSGLPTPTLPDLRVEKIIEVLPSAISFALLGSIESLLSAVVADGMSGRRHRSNCELVAQGFANMAASLFTGICVTGTIARTATNVRAGARGPISGMLHSLFLLAFMIVAAPLARFIPLAALAGVLAVVSWNMVEKHAFALLLKASRGDAAVLLSTFLLTVFRDLTEAIIVGFALGSLLFINRMSKAAAVQTDHGFIAADRADNSNGGRVPYDEGVASDPDIVIFRISGVFFFGATGAIGTVLDRIPDSHKALIVDLAAVPFLDSSAANTIEGLALKARAHGKVVYLTGGSADILAYLKRHHITEPLVRFADTIDTARQLVHADLTQSGHD
ncbi:MAG: SulP family inorganic anion transporter [Geminicoccaceae bacterium]|nr:SulP family inorganic anion transporter [Geminicoccaceae bacterium]